MNPNSQHQLWSRWTATVTPSTPAPPFAIVKDNCSRFYRLAFGSVTELKITATADTWVIDCRTEGAPAHDPAFTVYMTDQLRTFFLNGFGLDATVAIDVKLEAGDRQDGQPPDQLIIGPPPVVLDTRLLKEK